MTYQERLRALREDNDLTQTQIATMLGIAQTTYSQYELDKRPMPIEYIIALCKFYNVSSDYLLGLSDKK
ncbi:helix-turn-helix domain-containing protein [Thermoguttaceae bacterium LCP21S3_D4]|uniref:helix-turn-helix domain-containing protein n=1 Tax=Eubacterium ramulus TaxID=39490 RepID=UPI0022E75C74|nr:helix-turn-helix transcriptional regulator [Eubacterium ramulus]MCI6782673.1 helix-turn-helix domain-containing protein [Lachnospiraceae bacterium]